MIDIGLKYYLFGSQDSRDADVMIDHPSATGTKEDKKLIDTLKKEFPETQPWDINIINIKDSVVTKTMPAKGSIDSVHNSLFYTYKLHDQKFEIPIINPVERNLSLAVVRTIRNILTRFKGSLENNYYTQNISKVLKNEPWHKRIDLLEQLTFNGPFYVDNDDNYQFYKSILFSTTQTIMLLEGNEVYTKTELKVRFPTLTDFFDKKELPSQNVIHPIMIEFSQLINKIPIIYHEDFILEWNGKKVNYKHEVPIA